MFLQLILTITFVASQGYELKQVFVLSRHNIRTPFFKMDSLTSKKWPIWNLEPVQTLTPKGRGLEHSMGKYFSDWLLEQKLFHNCPKDQVFVHANTKSRTKETAIAFTTGAFGGCVSVYYKNNTENDPVFDAIIRNSTQEFKEAVLSEMKKKLSSLNLTNAFLELNRIIDIRNSSHCKKENICDLSEAKSDFFIEVNKWPDVLGALKIGWSLVDYFLMEYYDGMAPEEVAWGEIKTENQWKSLMTISGAYHALRFETRILDKHVASPLLKYFINIFKKGKKKLYLLVGHDANISGLMSSLEFKDYVLHDQIEKIPIGGKLVFQRWYDEENDRDLLKVEYLYQSTKQIRDGVNASLQNPPQWQTLEIEKCAADVYGFCPWNDFINILNTALCNRPNVMIKL